MTVAPCTLPTSTAIDRELVEQAFFADSYQVSLAHSSASVVDIFFAVFGHHPPWLKTALLVRHRVGAWFGLQAASTAEVMRPARAASYRVGQHIGPWPIYFLDEGELVAGRDNKHLDFRLSVLKHGSGPSASAVISTVCRTHNGFGRIYLLAIAPFHKWGVQRLIRRASQAGRL
nr:DUF2867 domain-containing protein [uncultured Roseateles sp.]